MSLILILILTTEQLSAQKDFEGMIKYKTTEPPEYRSDKGDASDEIHIYFGNRKILIDNISKGQDGEMILIALDSGKQYNIQRKEKSYYERNLLINFPRKPVTKEIIAGYSATPVQIPPNYFPEMLTAHSAFWYADSLHFHLPEKYLGNDQLLIIGNNRILLKARIMVNRDLYGQFNEEDSLLEQEAKYTEIVAFEIKPGPVPPSVFIIPKGYTLLPSDEVVLSDPSDKDTVVLIDTIVHKQKTSPPPPPPAKKKSLPSQKDKEPAAKVPVRKEDKP